MSPVPVWVKRGMGEGHSNVLQSFLERKLESGASASPSSLPWFLHNIGYVILYRVGRAPTIGSRHDLPGLVGILFVEYIIYSPLCPLLVLYTKLVAPLLPLSRSLSLCSAGRLGSRPGDSDCGGVLLYPLHPPIHPPPLSPNGQAPASHPRRRERL